MILLPRCRHKTLPECINMEKVSCIIPFYNEGERLIKILQTLCGCHTIDEIICVDDGSENDLSTTIKKLFPNIRLIKHNINSGKSEAVYTGLVNSHGDIILTLDADTYGLTATEVDSAINSFKSNQNIGMMILSKIYSPFFSNWLRADTVLCGDRIIRKVDLSKIYDQYHPIRYQLEIAINMYMKKNHQSVYWMPSSGLNLYKYKKNGFLAGMKRDFLMHLDLIRFAGPLEYFGQDLFFCRKKWV
jgi:glycosyltransferase involved in cell wall biosynthesis